MVLLSYAFDPEPLHFGSHTFPLTLNVLMQYFKQKCQKTHIFSIQPYSELLKYAIVGKVWMVKEIFPGSEKYHPTLVKTSYNFCQLFTDHWTIFCGQNLAMSQPY